MNVKPIPRRLLNDRIILVLPSARGFSEQILNGVRVERSAKLANGENGSANNTRCSDEITVWVDYRNSSWSDLKEPIKECEAGTPSAVFPVGATVLYKNELFEIFESKVYKAEEPHHCKFKAGKTGDE